MSGSYHGSNSPRNAISQYYSWPPSTFRLRPNGKCVLFYSGLGAKGLGTKGAVSRLQKGLKPTLILMPGESGTGNDPDLSP